MNKIEYKQIDRLIEVISLIKRGKSRVAVIILEHITEELRKEAFAETEKI